MPRHISEILDRAIEEHGPIIHPRIAAAVEREHAGEIIDWEEVYAQVDAEELRKANPHNQLLLGIA